MTSIYLRLFVMRFEEPVQYAEVKRRREHLPSGSPLIAGAETAISNVCVLI